MIYDVNKVDLMAKGKDGGIDMFIISTGSMDESPEAQKLLLDKVDTYLGFVLPVRTASSKEMTFAQGILARVASDISGMAMVVANFVDYEGTLFHWSAYKVAGKEVPQWVKDDILEGAGGTNKIKIPRFSKQQLHRCKSLSVACYACAFAPALVKIHLQPI